LSGIVAVVAEALLLEPPPLELLLELPPQAATPTASSPVAMATSRLR
jgi:hypothetical protein